MNVADRVKGSGRGHQVVVVCSAMGESPTSCLALCADASKGLETPVRGSPRLDTRDAQCRAHRDRCARSRSGARSLRSYVTLSQLEKLRAAARCLAS